MGFLHYGIPKRLYELFERNFFECYKINEKKRKSNEDKTFMYDFEEELYKFLMMKMEIIMQIKN
jgi:hypothetical protein